jgi:hypothetical protein
MVMLAGCDLHGLTRGQLYGEPPDALADAREEAPDAGTPSVTSDGPPAPSEGIFVTGFVIGMCHGEAVMVGGAGFHTCSYSAKGSFRLRIRNVPPGTRVELGARLPGYIPDPATAVITLDASGNTQNFTIAPATGSCDTVAPPPPCVCNPAEGCEPS